MYMITYVTESSTKEKMVGLNHQKTLGLNHIRTIPPIITTYKRQAPESLSPILPKELSAMIKW